LASSVN